MAESESRLSITRSIKETLDIAAWSKLVPRLVGDAAGWLTRRRWFGDKAREIRSVIAISHITTAVGGNYFALVIAEVRFSSNAPVNYFMPLAATLTQSDLYDQLAGITAPNGTWKVVDAFDLPAFRDWFLDLLDTSARLSGPGGEIFWRAGPDLAQYLPAARVVGSRVSTAEQSNTSILFGDALILKLFRKPVVGINPDVEIGHFLTAQTGYRNVPLLLGEIQFILDRAPAQSRLLGMAQSFVQSFGDGWSYTLRELETWTHESGSDDALIAAVRFLG
ncbi:MAG: hypothetical protein M3R06_08640, partial [Chloroflexota bacterium]|nr:hypothetical protein [Chloroflexota bacterium]